MKEQMSAAAAILWAVFLIPYLLSIFINGAEVCMSQRKIGAEDIVPFILAEQADEAMSIEALKAQAVVIRTNLIKKTEEGDKVRVLAEEAAKLQEDTKNMLLIQTDRWKHIQTAVRETEGIILMWENRLVSIPFHRISSGKTRNGDEAFHSPEYAYLVSVDSGKDIESEEYLSCVYIEKDKIPEDFEILEIDEAGYVTEMRVGKRYIAGDVFAQQMGLASSCFTMQKSEDKIRFLIKGSGHGLGLSQYGAQVLEGEGKNYKEILDYYFPKLTREIFAKDE